MLESGQIFNPSGAVPHADWEGVVALPDGNHELKLGDAEIDERVLNSDNNNKSCYWEVINQANGESYPLNSLIKMGFPARIDRKTKAVTLGTFDPETVLKFRTNTDANGKRTYYKA
jgi:hypothetical protein